MRADRVVGRLAGSDEMIVRKDDTTSTAKCSECRDMVPWTTLVERDDLLLCGDCHSDFLYWQQRLGLGGLPL